MRFSQTRVNSLRPPQGKADHVEFDDGMPGFGIRFRNGGAGTYFAQYKVGEKHGRLSLGKVSKVTLDAARAAARKAFAEVAERRDPAAERAKAAVKVSDTMEPLIDGFIAHQRGEGRSATYITENERSLRRYFKALHRFSVSDIDRRMVAKELTKIRTEHGPISADRSRAHLSKFFNWAIGEGLADLNPVNGTNRTGSKDRDRVLQDAELAAIWRALDDDDYGDICRLLILTGARRDEIGSLSRAEINYAQKQIELPGARTKNGRDFVLPLAPAALALLKAREPREGSDFVFGRGERGFSGWSNCKGRLDVRLGENFAHWTPHDFRRTLSTTMHERLGIQPHIVEAVLNHVSGHKSGVAGTYNRAQYLDEKRAALDAYAKHVMKLTRPSLSVVK